MKNIPLLIGTILGTLVLIAAVAFMFSGDSQTTENGSASVDPLVAMGDARNVKMEVLTPEENSEEAQNQEENQATPEGEVEQDVVEIVEFSDFQCPACKSASPLVDILVKSFPGRVKVVFRHFPLDSIHPNARRAAIASEAVSSIDKDKFWDMHDLLFENQTEWSKISNATKLNDTFVTYAEKLDIDRTEFLERIEDNSVAELVATDSNTGTQLGVNSTPTFFVNGVKVSAPQLLETVESLIVSKE